MITDDSGQQYESQSHFILGLPINSRDSKEDKSSSQNTSTKQEDPDYDMTSARADGVKPDARGHMPDTYKLPNHITFSDESKYNTDGGAGHWEQTEGDHWNFTPGPTNLKHHSMDELRDYFKKNEPDSTLIEPHQDQISSRMVNRDTGPLTDASEVDRGHNVPLIASALTKDGSSMYGMAIDHRVSTDMEFDGRTHDITPFLQAHEQAELPVMADLIKNGATPKDAYEQAHDKVANPTEAAARYAYAAKNNLDPDEFNKAYYAHIAKQMDVASQPSDQPRHPDAHTTRYGLDPGTKVAENAPTHSPIQMDVLGTQMQQGAHPGVGRITPHANENKGLETQIHEFGNDPNIKSKTKDLEYRKMLKDAYDRYVGPPARPDIEADFKAEQAKIRQAQKDFMIKKTNEAYEKAGRIPASDQFREWFNPDK